MNFPLRIVGWVSFLTPHFVQVNNSNAWFPEWVFIGFSLEPHSEQNSILHFTPKVFIASEDVSWA